MNNYIVIVPRADKTGPTNVAVDIAREAASAGWNVIFLYLSGDLQRDDIHNLSLVRKFHFLDIFRLRGTIHSHGLRPDLVAWLFTWKPHCKVATTLHGHFPIHLQFDYSKWKARSAWRVWSKVLVRFDNRICISRTMVRYYRRKFEGLSLDLAYNFLPERPSMQAPCPEIEEWVIRQRLLGNVVLLYAGSLTSRKNVLALVSAVVQSDTLSLIICGEGPDRNSIATLLNERKCRDRVILAGHVSSLGRFLDVSDVFVLPSHAEGLPLVVLEAARQGVPCLMSSLAVHREIAKMGFGATFNRFTFEGFTEQALALAADRSADSDARRTDLWRAAFSVENGFLQYSKIFFK